LIQARARHGDRFGIAYRPALAASLWANTACVDLIEVIADDWFGASRRELAALATLSQRVTMHVHAVGLGLASAWPVDVARVCALARVVAATGGAAWSEHLAFVRAGGIELGHLCAPPRTLATLEGLARNVRVATRIVGSLPALENVATLIDPPCSELDEPTFVARALELTGAPLLLDLHNLHANATSFGFDPLSYFDVLPLERVTAVHLAGGKTITLGGQQRVLDDHRHAVPDVVYVLLEQLASRIEQPIDVIVEHDGRPPAWSAYMQELAKARAAIASGRDQRACLSLHEPCARRGTEGLQP
jgi:uncharacterized protein (UPF0276 family)